MSEVGKTFCAPAMRFLTLVRRRVAAALASLLHILSYNILFSLRLLRFAFALL